ncbi:glutathione peroxidase [Nitrobacter winogradskyi]|uniref:Glutathione peroxidase n=2 Tax=Nitrobacter winogradskyi TaxID=913 RepID=A0ACC6AHP9_NITWI|nr:glutathione peroxidase [Nitrobacter winogradskyi]MCP1999375.1 glutathione peroxidase [Nitrobacter winogradskyi]GEC14441.1 glutathione peroxidase [Nitrobacter winogradskyi]
MGSVFDFSANTLDGEPCELKQFEGRVLLIVNTASACGFTPQYKDLEELHRTMSPRGFSVLGFPCNQFGKQEPGSSADIQQFCASKYDVTFPMFEKINVNGADAHPLFRHLKSEKPGLLGGSIKWNFTKFLVDRQGRVAARHAPTTNPKKLTEEIEALL